MQLHICIREVPSSQISIVQIKYTKWICFFLKAQWTMSITPLLLNLYCFQTTKHMKIDKTPYHLCFLGVACTWNQFNLKLVRVSTDDLTMGKPLQSEAGLSLSKWRWTHHVGTTRRANGSHRWHAQVAFQKTQVQLPFVQKYAAIRLRNHII